MGVCELNLLETSCNVASVSWLPAQHTKHLNALCPLDLACPPLECELCVCVCVYVSLHMARAHLNLFAVNKEEAASQSAQNLSHLRQQARRDQKPERDSHFNLRGK